MEIMEDFYLNILSWSKKGIIAIGNCRNLVLHNPQNQETKTIKVQLETKFQSIDNFFHLKNIKSQKHRKLNNGLSSVNQAINKRVSLYSRSQFLDMDDSKIDDQLNYYKQQLNNIGNQDNNGNNKQLNDDFNNFNDSDSFHSFNSDYYHDNGDNLQFKSPQKKQNLNSKRKNNFDYRKQTGKPLKLDQYVSSVQFNNNDTYYSNLAMGISSGELLVFDINKQINVLEYKAHKYRIPVLDWKDSNTLATAGKDKLIKIHDIRQKNPYQKKHNKTIEFQKFHTREICGLKFSKLNQNHLASGGNDNYAYIWDIRKPDEYYQKIQKHQAAIKAIEWHPLKNNCIITGGGNGDNSIRFFDTVNGEQQHIIDTGSQVTNLYFSEKNNKLVSSHGFSTNQIYVWNGEDMQIQNILQGHTKRVLYMAVQPHSEEICTGSGYDDNLNIWKVFNRNKKDLNSLQDLR